MMSKPRPRVKVPKTAAAGDVVTIKTLISHPMESGHRKDPDTGAPIPRKIINRFKTTFEGELVLDVAIEPSISANPYFKFEMKVPKTGTVRFEWTDDDGSVYSKEKTITVS
ncbi:MAG: thiosulfate oxidation carrier complex protein SoxZ [Neomegalonema sp.]|nr:thiosulfate oxidation carrier complex protein SoxZ [Neomegalonema sp.]